MKKQPYWFVRILLVSVILSACGATSPAALPTPVRIPSASATLPPAATLTAAATLTPLPTGSAVLNPLQIEAMRARDYPGSDITIEKVLDPGVNYSRYYVSYLSEGLKIYA